MTKENASGIDDIAFTLELFASLSPHVTFETILPGTRLYLFNNNVPCCYLIRRGVCRLHHGADEVLLTTLVVPGIIGIGGVVTAEAGIFIQTQSTCEIAVIDVPQVRLLIERFNLWELLSKHVLRMTNRLLMLSTYLTAPSAYESIRFQLLELMREPAEFREAISAAQYIQKKTRLSRSSIMKILAQLKQGGYVKLEGGILQEICHLPLKY